MMWFSISAENLPANAVNWRCAFRNPRRDIVIARDGEDGGLINFFDVPFDKGYLAAVAHDAEDNIIAYKEIVRLWSPAEGGLYIWNFATNKIRRLGEEEKGLLAWVLPAAALAAILGVLLAGKRRSK